MDRKLRIVFMGTPEFAVESLKALHASDHDIVGVVTATDKWGGRGRKKLIESDVKKYAVEQDLKVLQPKNLKAEDFNAQLRSLNADIQVVVAFRMLPEVVWDMPELGTINLHASLLPKYRGAAPINWAIINGEKETGVTSFKLKHKIDTGDIIKKTAIDIEKEDTAGSLHDKLMHLGARVLRESVDSIAKGQTKMLAQPMDGDYPKAPKIFFEDCEINFNQSVEKVFNFIRGLDPYPGAWTVIDGIIVKCYEATISNHQPGDAGRLIMKNDHLVIQCSDGQIKIGKVKAEGKRKMKTQDWLNGYDIQSEKVD